MILAELYEDFRRVVDGYLGLVVGDGGAQVLARDFEVAPSTVRRWALGTARPHPMLARQIIRRCEALLERTWGRRRPWDDPEHGHIYRSWTSRLERETDPGADPGEET